MRRTILTIEATLAVLLLASCATPTVTTTTGDAETLSGMVEVSISNMVPTPSADQNITTSSEITIPDSIVAIRNNVAITNIDAAQLEHDGYNFGDVFTVTSGSLTFTAPLVESADQVDRGSYYITMQDGVIVFGLRDGAVTGTRTRDNVSLTLYEDDGYLRQYLIRTLEYSGAVLEDFSSYEGGSMKIGHIFSVYDAMLSTVSTDYIITLIEKNDIATIIDITADGVVMPAVDGTLYFHATDLTQALRILISSERPYLLVLDDSDLSLQVLPILEALMGARLDQIITDAIEPYKQYYALDEDSAIHQELVQMVVDFFTELNDGTIPRDKALLSLAVNYLRTSTGLTTDEVSSLRLSLR